MTDGHADPEATKDLWLECVKGAASRGHLDRIPTRRAKTVRERDQARAQNHALTRTVIGGFGDNYDRIRWNHNGGDAA